MRVNQKPKPSRARQNAVRTFLETHLRPAIREDGGDIVFESMKGNTVHVRMEGLCSICPSAAGTIEHFVQARLREKFGQDIRVAGRRYKPYFWDGIDWVI